MNIVQFWHSLEIPDEIQQLVDTWTSLNPEATHQVFNKQSAAEFIQHHYSPEIYNAVIDITIPAMFCDVFRVAYILEKGGLYVDIGSRCNKPVKDWDIDFAKITLLRKWHGGVCNGLICAPAGHPWLQEIWDSIESVLLQRQEGNIFSLTGPELFDTIARKEAELDDNDLRYTLPGTPANERSMCVITQADFSPRFEFYGALNYKTRSHWSRNQSVIPLFMPGNLRKKSQLPKSAILGKKLVLYLAHDQSGSADIRDCYDNHRVATDCQSVDINLQDDCLSSTLEQATTTDASTCILWVDISSAMSGPGYNKGEATQFLSQLSYLCHHFASSDIYFSVMDQVYSIQDKLTASDNRDTSDTGNDEKRIKPFVDSQALDYNLIDEALRFFFPDSTLNPIWSSGCNDTNSAYTLTEQETAQIKEHFKDSNYHLFDKYPNLLKSLSESNYRAVAV